MKATQLEQIILDAYAATGTKFYQSAIPVAEHLGMEATTVRSIVRSLSKKKLIDYQFVDFEQPVVTRVVKPASTTGTSNADRVRARILQAKQNNEAPEAVIGFAVIELGMAPALAKVYTKNNWDRV